MTSRVGLLLGITFVILISLTGWFLIGRQKDLDGSLVSVTTDKRQYSAGETALISIRNLGDQAIDIYCPAWCALGNFPTTVEKFTGGQWQYYAGFCPSIEPLFGNNDYKNDYIRHELSAGSSFELEISNFDVLHPEPNERLRIVYYLGAQKKPIYSNEFTIQR